MTDEYIIPSDSEHTIRSSLVLGEKLSTDISIVQNELHSLYPIFPLTDSNNPLVFQYNGSQSYYVRPNHCKLKLVCQITKANGTKLTSTDKCTTVANASGSIFESVNLFVNEVSVVKTARFFPYRDLIKKLLTTTEIEQSTSLTSQMFYLDTDNTLSATNKGHVARLNRTKMSQQFELLAPIGVHLFQQAKVLPHFITFRLELNRAKDNFCLASEEAPSAGTSYQLHILSATLVLDRILIHDSIIKQHKAIFAKNTPITYYVNQDEVRTVNVKKDTSTFLSEAIFVNTLPSHVVIALTKVSQHLGKLTEQPFLFENHKLNQIKLIIDGQTSPLHSYEIDVENNVYNSVYENLLRVCNPGSGIALDDFLNRRHLICFELQSVNYGNSLPMTKTGTVKLQLNFKANTADDITCFVIGYYPSTIQVKPDGGVLVN